MCSLLYVFLKLVMITRLFVCFCHQANLSVLRQIHMWVTMRNHFTSTYIVWLVWYSWQHATCISLSCVCVCVCLWTSQQLWVLLAVQSSCLWLNHCMPLLLLVGELERERERETEREGGVCAFTVIHDSMECPFCSLRQLCYLSSWHAKLFLKISTMFVHREEADKV